MGDPRGSPDPQHSAHVLSLGPPLMTESGRASHSSSSAGTFSDTLDGIRDDSALLADMLLSPSSSVGGPSPSRILHPHLFPPSRIRRNRGSPSNGFRSPFGLSATNADSSDEEDVFRSGDVIRPQRSLSGDNTPRALSPNRSALSMLLSREMKDSTRTITTARPFPSPPRDLTPAETPGFSGETEPAESISAPLPAISSDHRGRRLPDEEEGTPLIAERNAHVGYGTSATDTFRHHAPSTALPSLPSFPNEGGLSRPKASLKSMRHYASPYAVKSAVISTLEVLPAVSLGLLLNILDGVSYGFIIFPAGAVFSGFGSLGVSMFFLTTVVSQLVYSLGGSSFPGATSSMIIEVIPFFHIIAGEITTHVGEDNPSRIIATTMIAFALSSVLTGIAFVLFGMLKLGSVIGFFPRHILVGCIGGVGVFLIQTGLNVAAGLGELDADLSWSLLKLYFTDAHILVLWTPAFALAVLLRIITHKFHHQLIFPMYFLVIPIIFYGVVLVAGLNLDSLRASGWLFDVGTSREPWYKFYSYFDFHNTSISALWATMPTQLALLFFNVLHPPLNVPALGVSLNKDDADLNLELTGHGVSNLIAGFMGVPSNYLAYVNSLLFYRVGGTTRLSGVLLALATSALLFVGTGPIAYIPVMEVGALIFVLGLDLVKEAVWDTRNRASRSEYITILGIMFCMTLYDFVSGVIFGLVLASVFFVIQNSRRHSIRNNFSGAAALSRVRRPKVGTQTRIICLQGYVFFGTISEVEDTCRAFLDKSAWEENPIRFLIVDLALVGGLDLSAAEAFVRVQRLLVAKRVILVFCGQPLSSDVAKALQAVDLWSGNAEVFATLNEALEWTENVYLRAWYSSSAQKQESHPNAPIPVADSYEALPSMLQGSFVNSPRQNHVQEVGSQIMQVATTRQNTLDSREQPHNTLIKTFAAHLELDEGFLTRVAPYFRSSILSAGTTVYRQGDPADGLYLIESGVLRATYRFADHLDLIEESCVAGTLSGELTALAGEPRNATVVAERQAVVWKLSVQDLARLERDHPQDAKLLIKLVLKTSKTDQDVLLASIAQYR
ncbi:hypothetical protein BS47DRAFT_1378186 [Hydnum rufescens UP504]|uniref:Sulfate transporter n=1 Tax=Hydnum rufescens UP504 TaxID=1448309 RepID=A0A9P6AJF0_9AGAM|nr:hypothetical protein BS47DRAFT_1378186 [Hydnum rufescens UP504]